MHVSVEYVLSAEELAELYPIYADAWGKFLSTPRLATC